MKISIELMFEVAETKENEELAKDMMAVLAKSVRNDFYKGEKPAWLYNELNFIKDETKKS